MDQVIAVKRMINQKVMKAPKDIAECLQLSDDCDIIRIKRVRYAGEEPFYLEINYFEQSFVPEVMEHDFSKESLRVFLSNAYQIQWSFAKQKIYSILADKEMAELLHIAVGSPLLYIRRISFDKDNHCLLYTSAVNVHTGANARHQRTEEVHGSVSYTHLRVHIVF